MDETRDPTEIPGQVDLEPGSPDPVVDADPSARIARLARGTRSLSAAERGRRQMALMCTMPGPEEATTGCTQVLHLAVFFDGTGNNRDEEMAKPEERRALSNIARLFYAHQKDTPQIVRNYLAGVGTPCPEVGDEGGTLGLAIGKGGGERVAYALEQLDALIDKQPPSMKILVVNVSVFGFSRGAAQARAFARDLAERCEHQADGGWHYRDIPIRIGFMGVFDTVCSVWSSMAGALINRNDGHGEWAHDVKLPTMVEQCVHMTAAHELRGQFPLDSTRDDAIYPPNTLEVWYPGVHSDVGGGYDPKHQGRKNSIARFALNEMYDMARAGGVLLQSIESLDPLIQDEFDKDDPELRAAYNGYLQAVRLKRGRMEDVQAAHMELLHRWLRLRVERGDDLDSMQRLAARQQALEAELTTLHRRRRQLEGPRTGDAFPAPVGEADRAEWNEVWAQIEVKDEELSEVKKQRKGLGRETDALERGMTRLRRKRAAGRRLTLSERTMLDAWDDARPLPEPVAAFFDDYGHDSVSHWFIGDLTAWRTLYFGVTKYKPEQADAADATSPESSQLAEAGR